MFIMLRRHKRTERPFHDLAQCGMDVHSIDDGSKALLRSIHPVDDFLDKDRGMGTDYMCTQNFICTSLHYYLYKIIPDFHNIASGCILVPVEANEHVLLPVF